MLNFGELVNTVQRNCHISDARYAGDYTLCVFLLKMRELYRWEHEIPFTGVLSKDAIGEWLKEREQMWDRMEASEFEPLPLGGERPDPFDSAAINRELVPRGYVYSGGYGRFNKPHFFLGNLARAERRDGLTIYVSSCEYARDLVAPPAMIQSDVIYVRQESLRRFIWEKIEEHRWSPVNTAMAEALVAYRFDDDEAAGLERMVDGETETLILHELGEGQAGRLLGEAWHTMLASLARSKAEIMARAVRDLLADCLQTLPALAARGDAAALHFYFANFGGMRRYLAPELVAAYRRWSVDGEARAIDEAATIGRERWLDTARTMLRLHAERGTEAGPAIETLLDPARAA
ncbi:MAG TPA: hypothetical protein VGA00_08980 [Acidiferrobacterales bacterium]